jgi:hypothetical protein
VLTGASAGRVDETAAGGVDASALELVAQGQSSGAPSSPSFGADGGPSFDHLVRPKREPLELSFGRSVLNDDVLTFYVAMSP